MTRSGSALASVWTLDPDVVFLNHGSFGACPREVLEQQSRLRAELERQPIAFMVQRYEPLMDAALAALGNMVEADPDDICFVANATTGVNTVLRSFVLQARDEVLVTDHAYNACRNALDFVAERAGATVVVAPVPFPGASPDRIEAAVLERVTERTRLALLDHVTSPTALVLPLDRLVPMLEGQGVQVLVDGAHAPGMLDLGLRALGASYYTGNCHKWLCAPKGAAFLYVRPDRQAMIRPLVISHGANSTRTDRSRFQLEMGWTGTADPTACFCVPTAIECVGALAGGWSEVRRRNHALAVEARAVLCDALEIEPPCPASMLGSMAAVPLPARQAPLEPPYFIDPLQVSLRKEDGIEVPVSVWPAPAGRTLRISAQLYNTPEQYALLAAGIERRRHAGSVV